MSPLAGRDVFLYATVMPAPSSANRTSAAAAASLSLFVFALSANTLPASLMRTAADFGITFQSLAQVSAVQFAGYFFAAVVGGVASDMFGKKLVLRAACLLMTAGAAAWAAAPGRGAAFAGAAVMGLSGGILESMGTSLLSDLYPSRRKLVLNLSQLLYCAGAIAAPFLMAWLLPRGVSWRWFFGMTAVSGMVLFALYAASDIPRPTREERIHPRALHDIARRARFWIPCLVLFCYVLSENSVIVFANAYLRTVHGAPESWAILSLSLFWASMGIGRLLCALIHEDVCYARLVAGLLTLTAACLAGQRWAATWPVSLLLFALSGLAFSGIWPLIVGMSASWNPRYSGSVLGTTIALGALGCVAAPPLVGVLMARLPGPAVFPVMALPLLLAAALLVVARKTATRRGQP